MAEKVAKLGISRDKDFMLYVKDGVSLARPTKATRSPQRQARTGRRRRLRDGQQLHLLRRPGRRCLARQAGGRRTEAQEDRRQPQEEGQPPAKPAKKKAGQEARPRPPRRRRSRSGKRSDRRSPNAEAAGLPPLEDRSVIPGCRVRVDSPYRRPAARPSAASLAGVSPGAAAAVAAAPAPAAVTGGAEPSASPTSSAWAAGLPK